MSAKKLEFLFFASLDCILTSIVLRNVYLWSIDFNWHKVGKGEKISTHAALLRTGSTFPINYVLICFGKPEPKHE